MMTKAYLESAIERHGEKAEIIIFARDALAYLDRSETAEAERDGMTERINLLRADLDTVTDDLSRSRAFARGLSANIVAAEEARDLAIVERDTVWNQADTFRAERDAVTVERDDLLRLRDSSWVPGVAAVVGQRDGETANDAVRRVVSERDLAIVERDEAYRQRDSARDERIEAWLERDDLRAKLDALSGGTHMAARAKSHEMQSEREAEIDRLRARVAELESAEAEPPQVFRVKAEVRITSTGNAEVRVCQIITDPAFYGLALRKVARLGLVVCDE